MRGSVCIIGVNLNGELVGRENEFQEKREICFTLKFFATPPDSHLFPGLAERLSSEWAVGNSAINTSEPGFANEWVEIVHPREKWRERARAPQPLGKCRLDSEGFRTYRKSGHNLGCGFHACKESLEAAQAFVDAFDGRRVRETQITWCAETF